MSRSPPLPNSLALVPTLVWALGGCASPPPVGLYGPHPEAGDWVEAHRLTERARSMARAPDSDPDGAENLLWRALKADPAHGPAYLQLGTILAQQGELDHALWAYAWAQRLMPGHPEAERGLHDVLDQLAHQMDPRTTP